MEFNMTDQNKKCVPELRFSEFKSNWKYKRLQELCSTLKSGVGITSANISEEGIYPVFGGNGLRGYTDDYTHDGEYFLIGRQGALCGNINRASGKTFISEHAIAVQANSTSNTEFLAQKLDFFNLNKLSESSAQPGLSVQKISRFKLCIPDIIEQTKIANFLSSVDKKIELTEKQLENWQAYKKGIMQQIFSQKIRFKNDNGEDFPKWEEKEIGQVMTNKCAKFHAGKENIKFPIVELENIEPEVGQLTGSISTGIIKSTKNIFKKNQILFGKLRPYLRKFWFASFDGICSSEIWVLSSKHSNVQNEFLYFVIQNESFITTCNKTSGTKMPRADWSQLENLIVLIPSMVEQTKIANFLSSIDKKIENIESQLIQLKQFKKGLLQRMFV